MKENEVNFFELGIFTRDMASVADEVHGLMKRLQAAESRFDSMILKMERLQRFLECCTSRKPYTCKCICRVCGESFEQEGMPGDLCILTDCYGKVDVVLSYND